MPADNDWIENEIEVCSINQLDITLFAQVATVEPLKLADGQEDFDLD